MKPTLFPSQPSRITHLHSQRHDADAVPCIRLHIENESGIHEPQEHTFTRQRLVIGREAANTLQLANGCSLVSRQHAEIFWIAGLLWVSDLGSKNATYLNGRRLVAWRPYPLHHGDCLSVGDYRIDVMLEDTNTYATVDAWL